MTNDNSNGSGEANPLHNVAEINAAICQTVDFIEVIDRTLPKQGSFGA